MKKLLTTLALLLAFVPALAAPRAPDLSFSAAPTSVAYNGATTLSWSSARAQSCVASGGWSGSKATSGSAGVFNLQATKTFTLTCTGKGGSTARSVTVQVAAPPPTCTAPQPATETRTAACPAGTTGSWTQTRSYVSAPYPTCWTATAWLPTAPPAGACVAVNPAPTMSFSAAPSSIEAGATSVLTWSSTNTHSCQAGGAWSGDKAVFGSEVVAPLGTATFSLTCTGLGGTVTRSATVTVSAPPPPTAELAWSAVVHPDVVGYRVYWGEGSRAYVQSKGSGLLVGNVTGYTVQGLLAGRTYFFAVTAVDGAGNESDYSNEGSKTF
jgi:hypothetical protein